MTEREPRKRDRVPFNERRCACGVKAKPWRCEYCGLISTRCKKCHDEAVHCREPGLRRLWSGGST